MTIEKTSKTKRLGLSLTGVTAEFKSEYDKLAKTNNMTHTEFARVLLENYKHFTVELTDSETDLIKQALSTAPNTYKKKIKKMILRCAASVVNASGTDIIIDVNTTNSALAADRRADTLLKLMFKHNETATNQYDKIFISKSSFLAFITESKESGKVQVTASKAVIDRCLERRSSLIEAHHTEQNLNTHHNLKAHYERLKVANSTNQPTGI